MGQWPETPKTTPQVLPQVLPVLLSDQDLNLLRAQMRAQSQLKPPAGRPQNAIPQRLLCPQPLVLDSRRRTSKLVCAVW